IRRKATFVGHGRTVGNIIAKVDVRNSARRRLLEDAKDIPGAQATPALVRVIEEINGRKRSRQIVDVTDADQAIAGIITPLLRWEGVVDKRVRVAVRIAGGVLGPALGAGLIGVIPIVKS